LSITDVNCLLQRNQNIYGIHYTITVPKQILAAVSFRKLTTDKFHQICLSGLTTDRQRKKFKKRRPTYNIVVLQTLAVGRIYVCRCPIRDSVPLPPNCNLPDNGISTFNVLQLNEFSDSNVSSNMILRISEVFYQLTLSFISNM
jgi:hypothetical protein